MEMTKSGKTFAQIQRKVVGRAVDMAEEAAAPYPIPTYEEIYFETFEREAERLKRELMTPDELVLYRARQEHHSALMSGSTTDGVFRIEE
jgi:hypothetical protein